MIAALSSNPSLFDGLAALTRVGVLGSPPSRRGERAVEAIAPQPASRPGDRVELSAAAAAAPATTPTKVGEDCECDEGEDGLTDEEREEVRSLEQRDRAVRSHEQAHKGAGGAHAGGISYSYQTGPDGKRYAVGGEVPIDISAVSGDPDATILKMQQVRRAALAPADPSSADRSVAAKAQATERQARAEKREAAATDETGDPREAHGPAATYGGQPRTDEPQLVDIIA